MLIKGEAGSLASELITFFMLNWNIDVGRLKHVQTKTQLFEEEEETINQPENFSNSA
jgi:hypothetical protein